MGWTEWAEEPRLWRLANMSEARLTDETFERDPDFDLQRYAERSFGVFQEKPVKVVLRFDAEAARDASAFLFHPGQSVEENEDDSLTVRFEAGGLDEMCWHLITWGGERHGGEARSPSPTAGQDVRGARGASLGDVIRWRADNDSLLLVESSTKRRRFFPSTGTWFRLCRVGGRGSVCHSTTVWYAPERPRIVRIQSPYDGFGDDRSRLRGLSVV